MIFRVDEQLPERGVVAHESHEILQHEAEAVTKQLRGVVYTSVYEYGNYVLDGHSLQFNG